MSEFKRDGTEGRNQTEPALNHHLHYNYECTDSIVSAYSIIQSSFYSLAQRFGNIEPAENGKRARADAPRRGEEGVDFTLRRRAIIPPVIYEPWGEKMGVSRCKSNVKRSPSGLLAGIRRIPLTPAASFDKYVDRFSGWLNGVFLTPGWMRNLREITMSMSDVEAGTHCTLSPASLFRNSFNERVTTAKIYLHARRSGRFIVCLKNDILDRAKRPIFD